MKTYCWSLEAARAGFQWVTVCVTKSGKGTNERTDARNKPKGIASNKWSNTKVKLFKMSCYKTISYRSSGKYLLYDFILALLLSQQWTFNSQLP